LRAGTVTACDQARLQRDRRAAALRANGSRGSILVRRLVANNLTLHYKAYMRTLTRGTALMELALIFPATLFMMALVVRDLQPLQYEPAQTAERIVTWYSARTWTLWLLLLAMPLAVLISGCVALLGSSQSGVDLPQRARQPGVMLRAPAATLLVAATTLTAAAFLVIVILHMLAN
jgi:hypothetical protein